MTFSGVLEAAFDCVYLAQLRKAASCQKYCSQREPVSDQCNATILESHRATD